MLKNYQKRIVKISVQIIFLTISLIFVYFKPFYIVKVVGDSMEPTILRDSIVLATTLDTKYLVGDVVVVEHQDVRDEARQDLHEAYVRLHVNHHAQRQQAVLFQVARRPRHDIVLLNNTTNKKQNKKHRHFE